MKNKWKCVLKDGMIHVNGKEETIDVTKFATLQSNITSKWQKTPNGDKDGLVIFSGDLFSPSIESSVTRGRHMVRYVRLLAIVLSLKCALAIHYRWVGRGCGCRR